MKLNKKHSVEGWNILVVDNGFVFVGDVVSDGKTLVVLKAKQLRVWGTTAGLGQITEGPTAATKADPCDTVIIPAARLVFALPANGAKWGGQV
tara:strand:+ start:2285 stop:2563 length:279 start_codon:yes stop_codon:yes gene_type:complete